MVRRGRRPPAGYSGLTVARNEWVGGRFRAPLYVTGEGPAYRPDVVLWLELGRQHLHTALAVRPSEPNQVLVTSLETALAAAGPRRRPRCVRVADRATAELLRAHFGSGLEIREAPTPEIDPVLEDMAQSLGGAAPASGFLSGGATVEQVGRLFAVAAKLYRIAPWRIVTDDDQLVAVEVPSLGLRRGCVSVIGARGEQEGLVVFQSVADYGRFVEAGERNERGDRPKHLGLTLTSLTFVRGSELPFEARREIVRHGWEVADVRAYPWLQVVEPDFVERPPSPRDVVLATAIAEALARFLDQHRALFGEPAPVPERESYSLDDVGEGTTVGVVAPHPEAPWDREPTADEAELLHYLEEERAQARKLTEAFVAGGRARGRDETWAGVARVVASSLFDFKIHEHDGQLAGLSAQAVERYLLDWVPARMVCDDDVLARMPESLETLAEWMVGEGLLTAAKADVIRRRIEAVRERFLRYVAEPDRFSAMKILTLEAQQAGVDPRDEAAMRRFVERRATQRRTVPRGDHPRAAPRRATSAPGPGDPCPCGSGRQYGECCMPR